MQDSLQQLHGTNDLCMGFRQRQSCKGKVNIVSKELTAQNRKWDKLEKHIERTTTLKARNLVEDKQEHAVLVNASLVKDSDFNFHQIHLLSHWANQILQYGYLP